MFDADNDDFGSALQVQYSDDYPEISFFDRDADNLLKLMALTKARAWRYEHEFRLLSKEPPLHLQLPVHQHAYTFPKERLLGIILGCEISSENENSIRELVEGYEHPLELRRARRSKDRYALELVDA